MNISTVDLLLDITHNEHNEDKNSFSNKCFLQSSSYHNERLFHISNWPTDWPVSQHSNYNTSIPVLNTRQGLRHHVTSRCKLRGSYRRFREALWASLSCPNFMVAVRLPTDWINNSWGRKGTVKIRPSRNKVETRYRVLARTISARGRGTTLFSERSSRVQFVSSREDTRRRVPPFPDREVVVFLPVMEPTISLVTFVITRDISRSNWLEIRRPRPSSGTVLRRGKQVWRLLWGGDTIDDRFSFFVRCWRLRGLTESFRCKVCWIKFYM